MGYFANSLGPGTLPRETRESVFPIYGPPLRETARLIPGLQSRAQRGHKTAAGEWLAAQVAQLLRSLPSPALLHASFSDLWLMACVFVAESQLTMHALRWPTLIFYSLMYLFVAERARMYEGKPLTSGPQLVLARIFVFTTALTFLALSCTPAPVEWFPLLVFSVANWLALTARRQIWKSLEAPSRCNVRNVMIIGDSWFGHAVEERLRRDPGSSRRVQEFLLDRSLREPLGVEMMKRIARQESIDEVIIASRDPMVSRIALLEARRNQLDVVLVPDLGSAAALSAECIDGMPLVRVCEYHFPDWTLALKRGLDVLLSLIALAVLSPVLLLVAIVIKLDSPGPALYRSSRVGRKGVRFICYKFRTMITNSDELKHKLRTQNERTGAFFKMKHDPRITAAGRFLRRYILDELPQLWNVLRGEMSLVGPRPHPADDVERYSVEDLRRLDFVPGVTGLWQITARQDPSFQRCVDLDVEYINRWSLRLDLAILFRTVAAVFRGSGA